IDVPERDAPFLRAAASGGRGNAVTLTVPALQQKKADGKSADGKFLGQVTLIAESLDPVTRTMRTEIHLPNPSGLLKPQMTGTATVVLQEAKSVFTVPSSAIVRNGEKSAVYCVIESKSDSSRGVVKHIDVELGVDNGRVVEVRRGLTGT